MNNAPDPMPAITAAIARLHAGDRGGARADLLALWEKLEANGAPLHRCTLAHFLADTEKDVPAELMWDRRALLAATGADDGRDLDPVDPALKTFLPSLHLNAGDAYRRMGDLAEARRHAEAGLARAAVLPDDGYGATTKGGLRASAGSSRPSD